MFKEGGARELRQVVFSPSTLGATTGLLTHGGLRSVRQFMRGKSNARYHQLTILATVAYLEWEGACGRLLDTQEDGESSAEDRATASADLATFECNGIGLRGGKNRWELYQLYGRAFKETIAGADYKEEDPNNSYFTFSGGGHGALFHMNQIASHQVAHRAGGPKIKAIEGHRRIWLYKDAEAKEETEEIVDQNSDEFRSGVKRAYSRRVDIILEADDGDEQWIELKSYKAASDTGTGLERLAALDGKAIVPWDLTTGKGVKKPMGLHRQFSLDRAAANVEHARLTKDDQNNNVRVDVDADFIWYFQKFKWTDPRNRENVEVSPRFGSGSDVRSIYGGLTQPIQNGGGQGERSKLFKANMGDSISASGHIKYAGIRQLLTNLASVGFEDATAALQEELLRNPEL